MPDICPVTADFAARAAWINRHAWLAGIDLDTECRQAEDEGRDLRSVRRAIGRLKAAPAPDGASASARLHISSQLLQMMLPARLGT